MAPSLIAPRVQRSVRDKLLSFYDYPHPQKSHVIIEGYDKSHARRTAALCVHVAKHLGHHPEHIRQYEVACLLHDLGRAGLDQELFGKIWSWAKKKRIPTRPREWRAHHPETPYGGETKAFFELYAKQLKRQGIQIDEWTIAQVEMRLGFAQRLQKHLRIVKPSLKTMGIQWAPWMGHVMLYYYYPEKLSRSSRWVHQLAEILVACEQLEAYSNKRRGRDYYVRSYETLQEAFQYLDRLQREGMITDKVLSAIRKLMTRQTFQKILIEARGKQFTKQELHYLHQSQKAVLLCQS